jgi:hypothetical protein
VRGPGGRHSKQDEHEATLPPELSSAPMIPLDKTREVLLTHAASPKTEKGRTGGTVVLTSGRIKRAHRFQTSTAAPKCEREQSTIERELIGARWEQKTRKASHGESGTSRIAANMPSLAIWTGKDPISSRNSNADSMGGPFPFGGVILGHFAAFRVSRLRSSSSRETPETFCF